MVEIKIGTVLALSSCVKLFGNEDYATLTIDVFTGRKSYYPGGGVQNKAMSYLNPLNETTEIVKKRRQFGMSIAVTQCVQL